MPDPEYLAWAKVAPRDCRCQGTGRGWWCGTPMARCPDCPRTEEERRQEEAERQAAQAWQAAYRKKYDLDL